MDNKNITAFTYGCKWGEQLKDPALYWYALAKHETQNNVKFLPRQLRAFMRGYETGCDLARATANLGAE